MFGQKDISPIKLYCHLSGTTEIVLMIFGVVGSLGAGVAGPFAYLLVPVVGVVSWQLAAAALVEELYVMNQNSEKFLSVFTDKAADDVTFRIVVILDALQQLTTYDADMKPVADAVAPLKVLNATSVAQLKTQLAEAKDQIVAARKALVK